MKKEYNSPIYDIEKFAVALSICTSDGSLENGNDFEGDLDF